MNACLDKRLSFGSLTLSGTDGAFPNILQFPAGGEGERMQVDIRCTTAGADGTSVVFSVQGCATEAGSYTDIVTGASLALAKVVKSSGGAPLQTLIIPKHNYKFLQVYANVTGTFTAGVVEADLNTYVGI